jgi:formylglycine-generating enzyme
VVQHKNMQLIPSGSFLMGSNDFYPEERPAREVVVRAFWIDTYPVTNAAFRRFVEATSYQTVAEQPLDPAEFPGVDPAALVPGALVFRKPTQPVRLADPGNWWVYVAGANWRHPEGPQSTIAGREHHPVVQIAYADALAYAAWARKRLPLEAEWEYAARGGLHGIAYAWGNELHPKGRIFANTWQGQFPWQNLILDGYEGTSPVGSFPANGYGVYDLIGNVWEWTSDPFIAANADTANCCGPHDPDARAAGQRVIKGGSYLCAPNYCQRYRPAARQGETIDTATNHLGFRCVMDG